MESRAQSELQAIEHRESEAVIAETTVIELGVKERHARMVPKKA